MTARLRDRTPPADGPDHAATHPLGVLEYLDLSRGADGTRGAEVAARRRKALAGSELADRLGYRRVWVPEHHGPGSPCANPLPTLAVLGDRTSRIRVGTAVTLLRLRDTALTAEDLAAVAGFCDGRLDVGLGRGSHLGAGADRLRHLVKDDVALDTAFAELAATLRDGDDLIDPVPGCELWLHGAGTGSLGVATRLGANYCHGLFLNPDVDACRDALRQHRSRVPDGVRAVALAIAANEDPSRAHADGRAQPFPVTAGTPAHCASTVANVLSLTGADEIVVAEVSADPDDHLHALTEVHRAVREILAMEGARP